MLSPFTLTRPTLMRTNNWVNNNGDTDTPVQNNSDKGSHNTDADQGSAVGDPSEGYRFLNWRAI